MVILRYIENMLENLRIFAEVYGLNSNDNNNNNNNNNNKSVALDRERTIPTERPPLLG
jgi:hypothetical protein